MSRVTLPALAVEFDEGGNTLWVQGLGGTLLRIKTEGKITTTECVSSPLSHGDLNITQDIEICIGFEQKLSDEYFDKINEVVKDMLATRGAG